MDLINNPEIESEVAVPGLGEISDTLTAQGITVHVVSLQDIEDIHRPFTFAQGASVLSSIVNAVRSIIQICKCREIDILHCNGLKAHVLGALARMIGGPPVIVHLRDIPVTRSERWLWHGLQYLADCLILVSNACWPARRLPSNANVVHNGIDVSHISLRSFQPKAPLNLGFVGRIDAAKGLHLLLTWIHEAHIQGIDLTLTVRGRFDSVDREYKRVVTNLISDLGLQDRVQLQGYISDPATVYADIDVICVPSHIPDPLPRSVMEPMAHGIPVIAYPAGGIPEMVCDRKTGFLVANADQFISAIRTLACNNHLMETIRLAARRKVETEFSITLLHANVNAIYQRLVRRPALAGSSGENGDK